MRLGLLGGLGRLDFVLLWVCMRCVGLFFLYLIGYLGYDGTSGVLN